MKHIYLFIVIITICFLSCKSFKEKEQTNKIEYQYHYEINTIEYNGHTYIVSCRKNNYGLGVGMVHDPDCKCNKK